MESVDLLRLDLALGAGRLAEDDDQLVRGVVAGDRHLVAVLLAARLVDELERVIADGELIFSKQREGRFPEEEEVLELLASSR